MVSVVGFPTLARHTFAEKWCSKDAPKRPVGAKGGDEKLMTWLAEPTFTSTIGHMGVGICGSCGFHDGKEWYRGKMPGAIPSTHDLLRSDIAGHSVKF